MDDYINLLNEEQKEIVLDSSFLNIPSALCIIACAGSGKTRTLISKIIYMIKDLKCDPEDFFITTFTKNAASEMRERLLEHLDVESVSKMTLGTFHSIAYSNIMNNCSNIVEDNIESYLHKYRDKLDPAINMYQDIVIEEQDEDEEIGDVPDDSDEEDDVFANIEFAEDEQIIIPDKQYKYVFIDEYQDINFIQEQIIKALSKTAKLLIVVGDDQQNIYTFRDTNIKYILNFTENYENSSYKYLVKNYRCNVNFVTLANIVLSYNQNKIDKTIVAMKPDKPKKVTMICFRCQDSQIINLTKTIADIYNNKKQELQNIAIISRNNSVLKKIEYKLASQKIPTYYIETNQDNIIARQNIQNIRQRVVISTIHGTKGLEFDTIYIVDVNSDIFPNNKCEDIEEDRRLLYVAITRAKNKLTICYEGQRPSCFINEIIKHPDHKSIINFKYEDNDRNMVLITDSSRNIIKSKEDYSIINIVNKMNYLDFETFRDSIFDYHDEEPYIETLHCPIPEYFGDFCEDRNLIITNISSVFSDFIETYISRSIQHVTGNIIENMDYVIYSLYYFKNGVEDIRSRKSESTVDDKFGTKLQNMSNDELERLILYYQSGIRITGKVFEEFIPQFIKCYKQYTSNKPSCDIIYDIFIISLMKGIIKGRNSILHLINFDRTVFIMDKINKQDVHSYKDWLIELEESYKLYFKDSKTINTSYMLYDNESLVKGIVDVQCDDLVIRIKTTTSNNPRVDTLMQAISYASLSRRIGININHCAIYNPLNGNMYTWDISKWSGENDVLYFLTEHFY